LQKEPLAAMETTPGKKTEILLSLDEISESKSPRKKEHDSDDDTEENSHG